MNQICYGKRVEVYRSALKVYGRQIQETVAIEELSEAIKEVCKMQRGEGNRGKLAEEIADATIMLEQLQLMYNVHAEVSAFMDQKICRLEKNIERDCNGADIWLCRNGG